jgi:hypothetical protein
VFPGLLAFDSLSSFSLMAPSSEGHKHEVDEDSWPVSLSSSRSVGQADPPTWGLGVLAPDPMRGVS